METTRKKPIRRRAVYKRINGIEHKLCNGPLHREGKFVAISDFFKRSDSNIPRHWCRFCEGVHKGTEPMVPYSRIKFAIDELIFRLGKAETARRVGVRDNTMWEWTKGRRRYIHRRIARRIIRVLAKARKNNEVRHRASIHHGSIIRGSVERKPSQAHEFNGPNEAKVQRARIRRERAK